MKLIIEYINYFSQYNVKHSNQISNQKLSLHKPFQLPFLIKFGWKVTFERNWEQSEYLFLSLQCPCYLIVHIYTTWNFLLKKKKLFGHSTFLHKNFSLGILPISTFLTQIMNTAVALIAKETCSREEKHYLIHKSRTSHFWVNTIGKRAHFALAL